MSSLDPAKTLAEVAELIKSGKAKRITLLTGAGASVASGIPDYRSAGGMYETLKPELLTLEERDRFLMESNPDYIANQDLFMRNQLAFHELDRAFIIEAFGHKWKPTIAQMFVRLLHDNGLLTRLYTQNIDGLDFDVGVPAEKIVCIHGTMRQTICESCRADPYDGDYAAYVEEVRKNIKDITGEDEEAPEQSSNIFCPKCNMPTVKPSVVLFGANLPDIFFEKQEEDLCQDSDNSDLMFVVGSSLRVFPAAGLPTKAPRSCSRVLVNNEYAGDFDFLAKRDHWLKGECDGKLLDLIGELGWFDQLEVLQDGLCPASREGVANKAAGMAPTAGGGSDKDPSFEGSREAGE